MDAGLAQVQGWSVELEGLCERIAPRLAGSRSAVGQERSCAVCWAQ
jgi:hypothetical protein